VLTIKLISRGTRRSLIRRANLCIEMQLPICLVHHHDPLPFLRLVVSRLSEVHAEKDTPVIAERFFLSDCPAFHRRVPGKRNVDPALPVGSLERRD
jgi:hypothetical protein